MHASLLAIFHGVPVIAVDQIRGGAKVSRHLSKIGYPVYNAWTLEPETIAAALESVQSDSFRTVIETARAELIRQARQSLETATTLILDELS